MARAGAFAVIALFLGFALFCNGAAVRKSHTIRAPRIDADPACHLDTTPISEIQGSSGVSPLEGESVNVRGAVTASWQGNSSIYLGGFFIQELAGGDSDPATSDAIFVFEPCGTGNDECSVSIGDIVVVQGAVKEWDNVTEISNVTKVAKCGKAHGGFKGSGVQPSLIAMPLPRGANRSQGFERWEGMLVSVDAQLTVVDVYNLGRRGEVLLSATGRLMASTQLMEPGQAAVEHESLNQTLVLDDDRAYFFQDRDPIMYPAPFPPGLTYENTLRVGDKVTSLTGILTYGCDSHHQRCDWRVIPINYSVEFMSSNPRPKSPPEVRKKHPQLGYSQGLKVAFANVENFMNGPSFPTPRGAKTHDEYVRQRAKVAAQIMGLDADVLGLSEIENNGYNSSSAIADLLAELARRGRIYKVVEPTQGILGSDVITVAIIYDPQAVRPQGDPAVLDSSIDPQFDDTKNRPVLAQTFVQNIGGGMLTLVVAHLKSKGSDCNHKGDPDLHDGQGNCPLTRLHAAESLVRWLGSDPTQSGCENILIVGDMNSYAMEPPIRAFVSGGYVPLIDSLVGPHRAYSFVYMGKSGFLDHALASKPLALKVTGISEWHINCDEPEILGYSQQFKTPHQVDVLFGEGPFRASDHDPILIGIDLGGWGGEEQEVQQQ